MPKEPQALFPQKNDLGDFYKFPDYYIFKKDFSSFFCVLLIFVVILLTFTQSQCSHRSFIHIINLSDKFFKITTKKFIELPLKTPKNLFFTKI